LFKKRDCPFTKSVGHLTLSLLLIDLQNIALLFLSIRQWQLKFLFRFWLKSWISKSLPKRIWSHFSKNLDLHHPIYIFDKLPLISFSSKKSKLRISVFFLSTMLNNKKFTSNRIPLLDCCVSFSNLFYFLLIRCGEYKKRGTTDILLLFFILFQDHHHLYKFYSRWSIQSDSDLSQQHSSTCVFCRYFYVGSLHFFFVFFFIFIDEYRRIGRNTREIGLSESVHLTVLIVNHVWENKRNPKEEA